MARVVIDTWRRFQLHALGCMPCREVLRALISSPDYPHPLYDFCCADAGRELFGAWTSAKGELIERLKASTATWGLVGLEGEEAEERAAALTALPGPAARALFATEDAGLRERQIQAVVAAYRRTGGVVTADEPELRTCALPECVVTFRPPPRRPGKRYCCDEHRYQHRDRPRPGLESTE
ncbi:MAG TPA: hypothetical protein VEQ15_00405 [Myxococcales bacterium]|nr:hypothetical protein [Myxococcales bacterium]